MMKHIRTENKKILMIFICIITAISILLSLLLNGYFNNLKIQYQHYQSRTYQYVYTTDQMGNNNSYYFINSNESTYLDVNSKKPIKVEILMDTPALKNKHNLVVETDILKGVFQVLNIDEVAISGNVARTYDLKIGDNLYINNNINGKMDIFKVKYIFKDIITTFDYSIGDSGGVVIIGYNPLKIYGLNYKYINFNNELPNGNFTKIYDLENMKLYIIRYFALFNALYVVLNIFVFILIQSFMFSKDKRYYEITLILGDDSCFKSNINTRLALYAFVLVSIATFVLEIIMYIQFKVLTWIEPVILSLSVVVSMIIFFYLARRKLII